jgi:hypothetical protein
MNSGFVYIAIVCQDTQMIILNCLRDFDDSWCRDRITKKNSLSNFFAQPIFWPWLEKMTARYLDQEATYVCH